MNGKTEKIGIYYKVLGSDSFNSEIINEGENE